jgi:Fur family transcriptional regulator, ferric uptake regulator
MKKRLRLTNVRNTVQRRVILKVFARVQGHVTLDGLFAEARRYDPAIGRATVYRTLRLLVAQGLASERHF